MERSQVSVVVLRTIFTWPVQTNRCELPSIRPRSQSTKTGFSGVAMGVRSFGSIGEVGGFREVVAVGFAVAAFEDAGFGAVDWARTAGAAARSNRTHRPPRAAPLR